MATILVAEDERDIRDLIKFTLELAGHQVIPVNNGAAALEKAAETMPDLIMLDMRMPKMNGLEACRAIKADESLRHIPVAFLSGEGMESDQTEGLEAGATAFINKPFAPDQLTERVAQILAQLGAV